MALPRTRQIRPGIEPSKDTTKTKVVIDEGTTAQITEQIGGKTVSYEATVKEDETNIEAENIDLSELLADEVSESTYTFEEVPKTRLEKMFDDLSDAVTQHNITDGFYAYLIRLPDSISDKYNIICRETVELGFIQFTTRDRFGFIPAIQEVNSSSGGRFHIKIHDQMQRPLMIPNKATFNRTERPVGLSEFVVPNPPLKPITENTLNPNTAFISVLEKMEERQRQFEQRMMDLSRKPEKSTLEIAMEQKMVDMIINGNQNNQDGNSGFLKEIMMMPVVLEQYASTMREAMKRPEPIAAADKTGWDKAIEFAETPTGTNLANKIGDMAERLPAALMLLGTNKIGNPLQQPQAQPQQPERQNPQPESDTIDMTEEEEELTPAEALLNLILDELDSDNAIDAANTTMQELGRLYPAEVMMLVGVCKAMPFDQVIGILQTKYPFAFEGMYDFGVGENAEPTATLNELGKRRNERLKEFYEFVKEQQ